jgi:hypothetical protein
MDCGIELAVYTGILIVVFAFALLIFSTPGQVVTLSPGQSQDITKEYKRAYVTITQGGNTEETIVTGFSIFEGDIANVERTGTGLRLFNKTTAKAKVSVRFY